MLYLDYNATSPLLPEAREAMSAACDMGGNPASLHALGRRARRVVDDAADALRALVGAASTDVVFTGSGSEADVLAVMGLARARRLHNGAAVVLLSATEHVAVARCEASLAAEGFTVRRLGVDAMGVVRLAELEASLGQGGVALVSVHLAHNETGVVQPVATMGRMAAEHDVPLHTDAVQAVGKIPVDFTQLGVTALSLSGHKLGAPRGIGALLLRKGTAVVPLWGGGGQQNGVRSGTPAVPLIAALGAAARVAIERGSAPVSSWRDGFEMALTARFARAFVIGGDAPRLPNTSFAGIEGIDALWLVDALSERGIMVSPGAACHAQEGELSGVLQAMGVAPARARAAVRFSCGWNAPNVGIEALVDSIFQVIRDGAGL